MDTFHHRLPTNGWRSLAWLTSVVSFEGVFVTLSVAHGDNYFALLGTLFIVGLGVAVCLVIWRWRRHPDCAECIVAEGYLYWHTPWPNKRTAKVALQQIKRIIVDGEQEGDWMWLETDDGERLAVPELGIRRRLGEFLRAVRCQSPNTKVTQYGQPMRPL